jgi:hypothetical protein
MIVFAVEKFAVSSRVIEEQEGRERITALPFDFERKN